MSAFRIPAHLRQHLPAKSKVSVFRRCLAALIRSGTSYDGFPFSFNVALYGADASWGVVLGNIRKHALLDLEALDDPQFLAPFEEDHDERAIYDLTVEQMCESLHDCDTYRMLSPKVAKRFGLSDDLMADVKFEFQGRCGKHLVVTEFNGHSLKNLDADSLLDETLSDDDLDYFDHDWARQLCAFVIEWSACFTSKAAQEEFEYVSAFTVASPMSDAYSPTRRANELARLGSLVKQLSAIPTRFNW